MLNEERMHHLLFDSVPHKDAGCGVEVECFLKHQSGKRVPYQVQEGKGIVDVLLAFKDFLPGSFLEENGKILGFQAERGFSLSLEPGAQFEYSSSFCVTTSAIREEFEFYRSILFSICERFGFVAHFESYDPSSRHADFQLLPKARYFLMHDYFQSLGLDQALNMMLLTCACHINLDYKGVSDFERKVKCVTRLQPLLLLWLSAQDPFRYRRRVYGALEGKAQFWSMNFVLDPSFSAEKWIECLFNTILIDRKAVLPHHGLMTLREFLRHEEGSDSLLLNQTSMPLADIRIKNGFFEIRPYDFYSLDIMMGLVAFWWGILYDETAFVECEERISSYAVDELLNLTKNLPTARLDVFYDSFSVPQEIPHIIKIAQRGLVRVNENTQLLDALLLLNQ